MQTIYTLGTQTMQLVRCEHAKDELFLSILRESGVDGIIDIRLHTEGRYYQFASGSRIKSLLEANSIAYLHEPRFAPSEEMLKRYKVSHEWAFYERAYLKLFAERHMIVGWREGGCTYRSPCLLCAERFPGKCHRRLLAELLTEGIEGARVIHLP